MSAVPVMDVGLRLQALSVLLSRHAFRYSGESKLHDAIATVLTEAGIGFEREYIFDPQNRADFYLPAEGIVIEVKVDGPLSQALHQACRYCALAPVRGVLLAATNPWALHPLDALPELHGRAFRMLHLQRRFL